MRTVLITTMVVCVLGLGLNACDESKPGAKIGARSDLIRRGNIEDPETLDPALAEDVHAFNILIDLYEGLIAEDANGNLAPGVAESWVISDDGLSYTFMLRPNARWSNGDAVTAENFVDGLRRVAAPTTLSTYATLLESIQNFAEVKSGEILAAELGVIALDERTLLIRLHTPNAYFLRLLAMPIAFPLHGDGSDSAQFEDPAKFTGNGAYILNERSVGSVVKLRQNEHYWGASTVTTHNIEYVSIADELAEFNSYRAGELDITGTIPPSHIEQAKNEYANEVHVAPSLAFYYLAFDLTEPPFDDLKLRQALSMAIDREQLVAVLGRGEQPAYAVVPPGVANYKPSAYQWSNLSKKDREQQARAIFASTGFGAEKPLSVNYLYDAGGIHEKIAVMVSAMWRETLGISVELEKREWKYFLDTRENRNEWQVMRFSWFGDYNDASTFLDIFQSDSEQNLPQYKNADYDQLIKSAAGATDREPRIAQLQNAEGMLIEDYPIAPLYFFVSKHMVKANISGFESNVLDRHPSQFLHRVD